MGKKEHDDKTLRRRGGRPRKKPGYDRELEIEELVLIAADLFEVPYDDREKRDEFAPNLNFVASEMGITTVKARRLLITAGMYSTELSRKVKELSSANVPIQDIMKSTNLGQASVYGYLPYKKGAYNLSNLTLYAEQTRRYRGRIKAVEELINHRGYPNELDYLWKAVVAFAGYRFDDSNLIFKYSISDDGILIENEKIKLDTIEKAYKKAVSGVEIDNQYIACIFKRLRITE